MKGTLSPRRVVNPACHAQPVSDIQLTISAVFSIKSPTAGRPMRITVYVLNTFRIFFYLSQWHGSIEFEVIFDRLQRYAIIPTADCFSLKSLKECASCFTA